MDSWKNHQIDFNHIDENSIIVDAGACHGIFIDFIRSKLNCKIYAIEPCKSNFKFLQDKSYVNVDLLNVALVGKTNTPYVDFKEYLGLPEWGSIYDKKLAHKHGKFKGLLQYKVKTAQMKDVFESFGVSHIDYLKLDIEGAEFDVFHSMDMAMSSKIHQFSAEIHKIDKDDSDIKKLIKHVKRLGYKCHWFQTKFELWGYRK